jgi:hypothetical protein
MRPTQIMTQARIDIYLEELRSFVAQHYPKPWHADYYEINYCTCEAWGNE